jgi:ketosteroid isomerase-like protein
MSDNTDVVRKAYDDFNSGNVDGVLEFWADDIRWEGSNDERLPGGGTYDGKEDAAQVLSNIPEHYEGFTSPGDEFLEDGDNVVVLGHAEGRLREPGRASRSRSSTSGGWRPARPSVPSCSPTPP